VGIDAARTQAAHHLRVRQGTLRARQSLPSVLLRDGTSGQWRAAPKAKYRMIAAQSHAKITILVVGRSKL
jgi:hypothetical protein